MGNMKKIFAILLAAAMAFGAFSFASAKTTETTREGVGMSIAGFSAHLLLSEEVIDSSSIADYDLTFINYWATWCVAHKCVVIFYDWSRICIVTASLAEMNFRIFLRNLFCDNRMRFDE